MENLHILVVKMSPILFYEQTRSLPKKNNIKIASKNQTIVLLIQKNFILAILNPKITNALHNSSMLIS